MNGIQSHLPIGLATGVLLYNTPIMQNGNPIYNFGAIAVGSIIADIDNDDSTIFKWLIPLKKKEHRILVTIGLGIAMLFVPNPIVKYIGLLLILSRVARRIVNRVTFNMNPLKGSVGLHENTYVYHRVLFHSILGIAINIPLVALVGKYIGVDVTYAFATGYGTHLIADMFTAYGVPLALPISSRRYRMPLTYHMTNYTKDENGYKPVFSLFKIHPMERLIVASYVIYVCIIAKDNLHSAIKLFT